MSTPILMEPRGYQSEILSRIVKNTDNQLNSLIELDCGLGKRFLQYSMVFNEFKDKKIVLVLQASTSLYETYNYLKQYDQSDEISIIDSRLPSKVRIYKLMNSRVTLSLPQTLYNTLKNGNSVVKSIDMLLINEVDQLIRRTGSGSYLKQPYRKLFDIMETTTYIGMSGTLRDEHYIQDADQVHITDELKSLCEILGAVNLISMNDVLDTDLPSHLKNSFIIPTEVTDDSVAMMSLEVDQMIESCKADILDEIRSFNVKLFNEIKRDQSMFFRPLPISEKLHQRLFTGYMIRKFLWAMPFERARIHLLRYGIDKRYVFQTLQGEAGKINAAAELAMSKKKSVILCSFLNTVDTLEELIQGKGIKTIKVTGQSNNSVRMEQLNHFRTTDEPMVALISNVGERDIDIPEAGLLIIFDLVRTVKTVYQKLKRSRNGECRILYYSETAEQKKVESVLKKMRNRYAWSTKFLAPQKING